MLAGLAQATLFGIAHKTDARITPHPQTSSTCQGRGPFRTALAQIHLDGVFPAVVDQRNAGIGLFDAVHPHTVHSA